MQRQQPPRRAFRDYAGSGSLETLRMKPEGSKKDVSFHQFFYRTNADKTIDAICAFCYQTAATADSMAEVHVRERAHRCPKS